MPIHENDHWSIETEDWTAETDGDTLTLTAPDCSATLRIETIGAKAPNAKEVAAAAKRRAQSGGVIEETTCGVFAGFTHEGRSPGGAAWREWLLTKGNLYLLATYSAGADHRERDRAAVDRMLATLAERRP